MGNNKNHKATLIVIALISAIATMGVFALSSVYSASTSALYDSYTGTLSADSISVNDLTASRVVTTDANKVLKSQLMVPALINTSVDQTAVGSTTAGTGYINLTARGGTAILNVPVQMKMQNILFTNTATGSGIYFNNSRSRTNAIYSTNTGIISIAGNWFATTTYFGTAGGSTTTYGPMLQYGGSLSTPNVVVNHNDTDTGVGCLRPGAALAGACQDNVNMIANSLSGVMFNGVSRQVAINYAIRYPIKASAAATITVGPANGYYNVILCDATAGNRTVALPPAASSYTPAAWGSMFPGSGTEYTIKKIDGGIGKCILNGASSETIDGAQIYNLESQWQSATIISNGVSWFVK